MRRSEAGTEGGSHVGIFLGTFFLILYLTHD